jgi:diguanylate cyclase (GGDEF)-like protein
MKVLVADDDATCRLTLKAIVSRLGHECLVASDGDSAWAMLHGEPIDVLLTDWMMPGMEGPELCRRVREVLTERYTYIVLITSLADDQDVLSGMEAGADDYLAKPVVPFQVQTRLVAASRVTALHRQVVEIRLELQRAHDELLALSRTDPLTALGNRRRMDEDLDSAHTRARRSGRPYSLALFDVDQFKAFNDSYGHPEGDETLRAVGRIFNAARRKGEGVYRYGGEEFVLLMPDENVEGAIRAAERLRRLVEAEAITHIAQSRPGVVTVSGGVSTWWPGSARTPEEMVSAADEALYRAKSGGRNQVCVAEAAPA